MDFFDKDFDVTQTLQKDSKGDSLKELQALMHEMIDKLRKKVAKGLKKEDFANAQMLIEAYETASKCLATIWKNNHK